MRRKLPVRLINNLGTMGWWEGVNHLVYNAVYGTERMEGGGALECKGMQYK
jgi:hypothetical protein